MAKQRDDLATADMFGRPRGRPKKPGALTAAQRAKRYRDRKKAISVTNNEKSTEGDHMQSAAMAVCADVQRAARAAMIRAMAEKLMEQAGFQKDGDFDILQSTNPRARQWVKQATELLDIIATRKGE